MSPYRQSAAPLIPPTRPPTWAERLERALRRLNRKLTVVSGRAMYGRLQRWRCATCEHSTSRFPIRAKLHSAIPRTCAKCSTHNLQNALRSIRMEDPFAALEVIIDKMWKGK